LRQTGERHPNEKQEKKLHFILKKGGLHWPQFLFAKITQILPQFPPKSL
jgi:hypothetical protein